MLPPFSFLFLFPLSRHSIHFNRGTLSNAIEFRFEEYTDPSDGNFRILPNVVSPYVLVTPVENFAAAGQTATIVIDIDNTAPNSTRIYRANPGSNWNFVSLTTEVRDGNAYAQTDGVAVAVYFVVRPEKWKKTKDNVRKTKTKVSRSFAKQV